MSFRIKEMSLIQALESKPRKIHPLDMILFDGDSETGGEPISGLIKALSKVQTGSGQFSHVGIVVTSELLPEVKQLKKERLYVLESTFSHKVVIGGKKIVSGPSDVLSGGGVFGVQIRDLGILVEQYSGDIYRGRLLGNPWVLRKGEDVKICQERRNSTVQKFSSFFNSISGQHYNLNPLHLAGAITPKARRLRNDSSLIFEKLENLLDIDHGVSSAMICSEMVISAYKALGLVPESVDARDAIPVDVLGSKEDGIPNLMCPWILKLIPNRTN